MISRRTNTAIGMALLAAVLSVSGCATRVSSDDESCVSRVDCALGLDCVDGTCEPPSGASGPSSSPDAGSGFAFDAGPARIDARPAEPDAGYAPLDAGYAPLDAGRVDGSMRVDAGTVGVDAGSSRCGVAACVLRGAECGAVVDECGVAIDCGRCLVGQACGAAGTPFENRCRCEPRTCQPNQCGTLSDGCGATIVCPGCGAGRFCGPQNQCVCTPRTCSEIGAACGQVNDGCGGTTNCGTCSAPDTCGGAGVANQCGNCNPTRSPSLIFGSAQNSGTGGPVWQDLSLATQDDRHGAFVRFRADDSNSCRPTTRISNTLTVFNAGANIPRDAKITGFSVFLYLAKVGRPIDLEEVYLARNNSFRSDSKSHDLSDLREGLYRRYDFGGENDMWGLSRSEVTPAMLSTGSFSVRLRLRGPIDCGGSDTRGFVDFVRVMVHYEPC